MPGRVKSRSSSRKVSGRRISKRNSRRNSRRNYRRVKIGGSGGVGLPGDIGLVGLQPQSSCGSHGGAQPQSSCGSHGGAQLQSSCGAAQPRGYGNNHMGGGVMPAEFYGGNSGRYYEAGSPELANCESAYGTVVPTSHGVVMGGENAGYMGPNLAAYPAGRNMQTGGRRRSRSRSRSRKSSKKRRSNRQSNSQRNRKRNRQRKSRQNKRTRRSRK